MALFSLTERSLTWNCQLRFASILTSRYFTLFVGYSHLQHSLTFKWRSNFFCLDLKTTVSVFQAMSEVSFAFSQLTSCFKSTLTSLFSFLIELLRHNKLVSSANWWTLQNFVGQLMSFIYSRNGRALLFLLYINDLNWVGPRTEPLGTLQFTAARPESWPCSYLGYILIAIRIRIVVNDRIVDHLEKCGFFLISSMI